MNYEPKLGDVVSHWRCWKNDCECLGRDGVVIEIGVDGCFVRFKDGEEMYIFVDNLTFISRPEPSPETALRDHFAGLAMAAMVGNVWESVKFEKEARAGKPVWQTNHLPMEEMMTEDAGADIADDDNIGRYDIAISISAYRIADAMLDARGEK